MARYANGWIKVDRRMVIEDIGDNAYALALWTMLLAMANWKESKIIWMGKQRVLPPGSVVFGFREFSERWECSKTTVKKWAQYLHDTDRIVLEVCPRGCIATIRNWSKYQANDEEVRPKYDHQVSTECPPSVHRATLNEEGKKERIEENTKSDPKFSLSEENLNRAYEAWLLSLRKMKAGRANLIDAEQRYIAIAIRREGVNAVVMALSGVPHAKAGDGFDPSWFMDVSRVLNPKNFMRFMNLGVQAHNKEQESA